MSSSPFHPPAVPFQVYTSHTFDGSNLSITSDKILPYYSYEYMAEPTAVADCAIDPALTQTPSTYQGYVDMNDCSQFYLDYIHEDMLGHSEMVSSTGSTPAMSTASPLVMSPAASMIGSPLTMPSTPSMSLGNLGLPHVRIAAYERPRAPYSAAVKVARKLSPVSADVKAPASHSVKKPNPNKNKNHGRKKPEGHIPRPENSFMCFRRAFFNDHQWPTGTDQQVVSKMAAQLWNGFSEAEKAHWYAVAAERKKQHAKMFPEYRYKPGVTSGTKKSGSRRAKKGPTPAGMEALRLYRAQADGKEMLKVYVALDSMEITNTKGKKRA